MTTPSAPTETPRYLFRNFNVWLDGVSYLGQAHEIDLPNPKVKTTDYEAAGMVMPIELQQGFEKIEGKVKMPTLHPSALALFGLKIGDIRSFMATGAFVDEDGTVHSCVVHMWGFLKEVKLDTWKIAEKKMDTEYHISLRQFDLEMDGQPVLSMSPTDVSVGGVSQTASVRAALLI